MQKVCKIRCQCVFLHSLLEFFKQYIDIITFSYPDAQGIVQQFAYKFPYRPSQIQKA